MRHKMFVWETFELGDDTEWYFIQIEMVVICRTDGRN